MIEIDLDKVLNDSDDWPSDEEIMAARHLFTGVEDVLAALGARGDVVVTWLHGADGKAQPVFWPIPHRTRQGNTYWQGIMGAYSPRDDH